MPFFLKELSLTISLHPSYFGPHMRDFLKAKLLADVEGTCSGQYGYIICVLDSNTIDIDKGKVIPGQGFAEFEVKYRAILWRPFRVGLCIVSFSIVTLTLVIGRSRWCCCDYSKQNGFLCWCWPSERVCIFSRMWRRSFSFIFTNKFVKLVPPDMTFDPAANPPNYSGEDQVIEKGSNVRLKIVGTRTDATEIVSYWFLSVIRSLLDLTVF